MDIRVKSCVPRMFAVPAPYSARHLSIVYCGRGDKKEQKWDQYNGLDERLFISPGGDCRYG